MTRDAYGNDPMFCEGDLGATLDAQLQQVRNSARTIPPNKVLNTPLEDLTEELVNNYRVAPIVLDIEAKFSSGASDADLYAEDMGRRFRIDGTQIVWKIPFTGDSTLFMLKPRQWTTTVPRGRVDTTNHILEIRFKDRSPMDAARVESYFQRAIQQFETYVDWQIDQIDEFNNRLVEFTRDAVRQRKEKVLADRELDASLDVPLEARDNSLPHFTIDPPKRTRSTPSIDRDLSIPFSPEPAISEDGYSDILREIASMTAAVERLPDTFSSMPEESLRDVLLVILNNRFGPASGETFSRSGKTDILIPYGGEQQAVFVAECKLWKGPSAFRKAIDQLLGYLIWRDTKAALIVFVKTGNPSEITAKATSELAAHPQYKRDGATLVAQPTFILGHAEDTNREIQIALVVVPILGET